MEQGNWKIVGCSKFNGDPDYGELDWRIFAVLREQEGQKAIFSGIFSPGGHRPLNGDFGGLSWTSDWERYHITFPPPSLTRRFGHHVALTVASAVAIAVAFLVA